MADRSSPSIAVPVESTAREALSRERIMRAAVRIMDQEGVEAVTMRRLGRELGVEAMSLYNHVRDKEEILTGIIESVMMEFRLPAGEGDWLSQVRTMAVEFRRVLLAHPNVVQLIAEHHGPPTSPDGFQPVEVALSTLRAGGLSYEDTTHAYRALVGYVMGYVTLETGGLLSQDPEKHSWAEDEAFLRRFSERLPTTLEMLPYLAQSDNDSEFEFGLDMLLEGLRARLRPGNG
jgi:AcrR family transcriptional regulator